MAIVVKIIRGRQYRYEQTSRRANGKVKTTSVYIGPVSPTRRRQSMLSRIGGFISANFQHGYIGVSEETLVREQKERDARRDQALENLHTMYGLTLGPANPVPIDKTQQLGPIATGPQTKECSEDGLANIDTPSSSVDGTEAF